MSEKFGNNNSDSPLTVRRTVGGKNETSGTFGTFAHSLFTQPFLNSCTAIEICAPPSLVNSFESNTIDVEQRKVLVRQRYGTVQVKQYTNIIQIRPGSILGKGQPFLFS